MTASAVRFALSAQVTGKGVRFIYEKRDGGNSLREGAILAVSVTSRGERVWLLDGEGNLKQFSPEGIRGIHYV